MKRIILIISIIQFVLTGKSQNYNVLYHYGSDEWRVHQCFNIIEASDGSVIVGDNLFDNNFNDAGKYLYKINCDAEIVDSLLTHPNTINALYPVLKDPFNDDNNIITSFFSRDGNSYFSRICFNDELEITETMETMIFIPGLWKSYTCKKYLVNDDNDIVVHVCASDTTEMFFVFGLDGETKYVSEPVVRTNRVFPEHPLFTIRDEPRQYGMLRPNNSGSLYIEVFDGEFKRIGEHKIPKIDGYSSGTNLYDQAVRIDDEHFLVTAAMMKSLPNGTILESQMILKFNSQFEIVSKYSVGSYDDMITYRNIAVTDDGRVYFVWRQKGSGAEYNIVVDCLDTDLNLIWERVCHTEPHANCSDILALSNGGLVIIGQSYKYEASFYDTKDFYAVIFDAEGASVAENSIVNPFRCYPNPCITSVNIDISPDTEVVSISLYDLCGRMIRTQTNSFENVDISGFAPGVYVMKVVLQNGKTFEEKIVKK